MMPKAKKTKKDEDWMGFYNGKIPKKLKVKRKKSVKPKPTVYQCFYCSNKSDEGDGAFVDNILSSEPSKKFWVCSPCIEKHVKPTKAHIVASTQNSDDEEDDGFQQLTPWERRLHEERQKSRNFWLMVFGVLIIAIILSLVERSRIFSVVAVVALVAVFLLYKYEVKI
jgi:hypothetical protein